MPTAHHVRARARASGKVGADDRGELEHRHLRFAEDRQQPRVGVDGALVDGILQTIRLDVDPQLLDHFGAGQRLAADDGRQFGAGRQRLAGDLRVTFGARLSRLLVCV